MSSCAPAGGAPSGGESGITRMQLLAVLLTALVVYLPTLGNGFVWDDITHIVDPGPLQSLENISFFFSSGMTSGSSFGQAVPYYRPLSTLSLALDYALWGGQPLGFHLTNLLLHGAATLLVTLLAAELLGSRSGALASGFLFAVHPVHAEAVAYVATRNELLCTLLALGALVVHCRWRQRASRFVPVLVQLLFFASLLAKEMSITLPLLVLLAELLCFRTPLPRALGRALPFVLTAVLFLVLRTRVLEIVSWESPPLGVRLATSITLVGDYLRLLLVPWPLRVLHDVPVRWHFGEPAVLLWGVLLAGGIGLLLVFRRSWPLLVFGVAWLLLSLLPVSGLPAFIQPALMAERYLYLPSVGFCLACGGVVALLGRQSWFPQRQRLLALGGGALLAGYGLLAAWHGRHWHDEEQFYRRMIADAPAHPLGYHELGNWYGKRQRYAEMAAVYRVSLELTLQQQEHLGRAYLARGDFGRAEREYLRLLEAKLENGTVHNNLGLAYAGQGKRAEALSQFRQAVAFEPDNAGFRENLARYEQGAGR